MSSLKAEAQTKLASLASTFPPVKAVVEASTEECSDHETTWLRFGPFIAPYTRIYWLRVLALGSLLVWKLADERHQLRIVWAKRMSVIACCLCSLDSKP